MKVAFVTRSSFPFHRYGGMERYFYHLAKFLGENGINVSVITASARLSTRVTRRIFRGIKYIFLPSLFPFNDAAQLFSFSFNVMKYLTKRDPSFDIIHGGLGVGLYVMLRQRKPVIAHPFGLEIVRYNWSLRGFPKLMIAYPLIMHILKRADRVSVEMAFLKKVLSETTSVDPKKIFILPDGVDLDEIEAALSNQMISREDLGLNDADIVLINVNRLERYKGIEYLIRSLKILNAELLVKLLLIGAGSQEARIRRIIAKFGLQDKIIHFKNIPYRMLYQLLSIADISVTPTLGEGIPIVVLEAMACGKPVVASKVPGIIEVVKHGVNGFLVRPADSRAIADAILKMYDKGLISKMGQRSKELVKAYDWNVIVRKVMKIYENVINEDG